MEYLHELFEEYNKSPKTFSNRYMANENSYEKNIKSKEYIDAIDNILYPYYELYGKRNFSEIFYVIKNGKCNSLCKKCNAKPVIFKNYKSGYNKYCSSECARKDGSKTSDEKRKEGTEKRRIKMRNLLNDPILGKEYRDKLSASSTYHMSLPEQKEMRSLYLKEKIYSGEWTPNITNSWTHRESKVNNIPFRSSYEALFYIYNCLYKNNIHLQFEKLRIKYNYDNKEKIYIVDFIDYEAKNVYEIKPKSLAEDKKNVEKRKSLINWCKENAYQYFEITENDLKQYLNEMIKANFTHDFLNSFIKKYKKWLLI